MINPFHLGHIVCLSLFLVPCILVPLLYSGAQQLVQMHATYKTCTRMHYAQVIRQGRMQIMLRLCTRHEHAMHELFTVHPWAGMLKVRLTLWGRGLTGSEWGLTPSPRPPREATQRTCCGSIAQIHTTGVRSLVSVGTRPTTNVERRYNVHCVPIWRALSIDERTRLGHCHKCDRHCPRECTACLYWGTMVHRRHNQRIPMKVVFSTLWAAQTIWDNICRFV